MNLTVPLAFGDGTIDLAFDTSLHHVEVLMPRDPPAHPSPHEAFLQAVENPHGDVVPLSKLTTISTAKARSVCIVVADHTRPVPDRLLVPWIITSLGIRHEDVTILIGTGTHRGSTREELERMLGSEILARCRVMNHDCGDEASLIHVGTTTCGGECWLHRAWVQADLRICTGFIEPHFYAGFSGGSKAVVPGVSGLKTVRHFHRASLIAHPMTTWGDPTANPLQKLTRDMITFCPPHFIVNVTLNLRKEITAVFAGACREAHDAGCAHALREAMIPVSRVFPLVITTNSGYPLDQNFYQTVKGISAACRIVETGGTVLVASECRGGLPPEGEFGKIMADVRSSEQLHQDIKNSTFTRHDQWGVQTLLQCLDKARIILHSRLPAELRSMTRTQHTDDMSRTLENLTAAHSGRPLAIAVLPMGPLTIPMLEAESRLR